MLRQTEDSEAHVAAYALIPVFLEEDQDDEVTPRGRELDDVIGIAYQMARSFYD